MNTVNLNSLDSAWLDCLRRARCLLNEDGRQGATLALIELPPIAVDRPEILVGSWCFGGFDLAVAVAAHGRPEWSAEQCAAAVIDALSDLLERDQLDDRSDCPESARWIVENFELGRPPAGLLEGLRLQILIETSSDQALVEAIKEAVARQDWSLTLRGIERLRLDPNLTLPPSVYGLAATSLHHLERYEEANEWLAEGLGEKSLLVAPLSVPDEARIIARWEGRVDPLVSIICTTYNHERFVESALRGFLGQDCKYPFEILIHDDASTDATQAVIRRWRDRYPNLIKPLLQTRNQFSQGIRPWETMLARARGDFIALCEGDDYWIHPGKLSLQIGYLLKHPDVVCSAHNHYHLIEMMASVLPGQTGRHDVLVSAEQLMGVQKMLWAPTLVFRRLFTELPPERDIAAFGDQFLISYLGTFGKAACFDSFFGAVRRENEFSTWSPLPEVEKERRRVQTWAAIERLHLRLGNQKAADRLGRCVAASSLAAETKSEIIARAAEFSVA
ncbi:MAG: glycosyltransferase [Burkholderiaceae bacterium]